MAVKLRCPSCRGTFSIAEGWPTQCELCGYDTSIPQDRDEVEIPAFLSPRVKSADATYRQIEQGSADRAHMAAEVAGCDVSDMAGLKVTNLRDNPRPGDVAAIDDVAAAQRLGIRDAAQLYQPREAAAVASGASAGIVMANGQVVGRGVEPRAGFRAQQMMQRHFNR